MINYEAEVKRVYPEASVSWIYSDSVDDIVIFGIYPIDTDGDFKDDTSAWQSAYETLKKQGKL